MRDNYGLGWIDAIPRGVGHTRAATGGGDERVVIFGTAAQARDAAHWRPKNARCIPLDQAPDVLAGLSLPVVFDVTAVLAIASMVREEREERANDVDTALFHVEHALAGLGRWRH